MNAIFHNRFRIGIPSGSQYISDFKIRIYRIFSIFVLRIIFYNETVPLYKFHKCKYGNELLIDVLDLDYIKPGIRKAPVHRESFYCIILITEGCEEVAINGNKRTVRSGEVVCSRPFVDHAQGIVANGSMLGKHYAANVFDMLYGRTQSLATSQQQPSQNLGNCS